MPTLADLWLARHLRDELGAVPLLVPLLTFFFFVVVLYSGLDFKFTYVLLAVIALVLVLYYAVLQLVRGHREKARQSIDIPNFTILKSLVPMNLGVLAVFVPFFLFLIATGQGISALNPITNGEAFIVNVVLVAPTEEFFFRWTMPQFYGGLLPQILFGISHPAVRDALLTNPAGAAIPFVYYFVFGLLFQQLVFMGQASNVPTRLRSVLGLPFVIGLHGAYNTVATLFPGTVLAGQQVTVFTVAPHVLVLAVLVGLVYAVRNIRRSSMRRGRDPRRSWIRAQLTVIPEGIDNSRE